LGQPLSHLAAAVRRSRVQRPGSLCRRVSPAAAAFTPPFSTGRGGFHTALQHRPDERTISLRQQRGRPAGRKPQIQTRAPNIRRESRANWRAASASSNNRGKSGPARRAASLRSVHIGDSQPDRLWRTHGRVRQGVAPYVARPVCVWRLVAVGCPLFVV
jgi:hypothetical protein